MARDVVTWDSRQLQQYARDLKRFALEALPFATREALNNSAKMAQGLARENIQRTMIQRNRFTMRGVGVELARQKKISHQRSVVGHFQSYMNDQEFGFTKKGRGKHGAILPTRESSGEGEGSAPRQKVPKFKQSVRGIRLSKKQRKGKNRRQQNLIRVKEAAASGRKIIFMRTDRVTGYFKVTGGKRKPRPRLIADLSEKTYQIDPHPWLFPAVKKTEKAMPGIYERAIRKQLIKRRLFVTKKK